MKKVLLFLTILFSVTLFAGMAGLVGAEEYDAECQRRKAFDPAIDCTNPTGAEPEATELAEVRSFLFFSTRYDGTLDNIPEIVRLGLIVVFSVIAVVLLGIGMYGMFLYSTAQEDDEQIALAQKVLGNAIIGLLIAVFAIVIVQLVAMMLGVDSSDLFTFDVSGIEDSGAGGF